MSDEWSGYNRSNHDVIVAFASIRLISVLNERAGEPTRLFNAVSFTTRIWFHCSGIFKKVSNKLKLNLSLPKVLG